MRCPIAKLSNEVLREIFLHTRDERDNLNSSHTQTPWTLLDVNEHWAQLSSNVPQLWDSLLIELDEQKDNDIQSESLSDLDAYLVCGRRRPLDLTLILDRDYLVDTNEHPIFDALVAAGQRWRHVVIQANFSVFQFLENVQTGLFHSLESIHLNAQASTGETVPDESKIYPDERVFIGAFYHSTQLTEAHLGDTPMHYNIVLQKSKLERYTSNYQSSKIEIPTLAVGKNLVHAKIYLDEGLEDYLEHDTDPMFVPLLETLEIATEDIDRFTLLFPHVDAPELVNLSLELRHGTDPQPAVGLFESILDFIDRSQCELNEFSIRGPVNIGETVIPLLWRLPNLRRLTLKGSLEDDVISTLPRHFAEDESKFLPALEAIDVGSETLAEELMSLRNKVQVGRVEQGLTSII